MSKRELTVRKDAIAAWLQQRDDEFLYTPDVGQEGIPGGEQRFAAAILHRETRTVLLAVATTAAPWVYDDITYQPCEVFDYDFHIQLQPFPLPAIRRCTLTIEHITVQRFLQSHEPLASLACVVIGQEGPYTILVTHQILCSLIDEQRMILSFSLEHTEVREADVPSRRP